MHKIIFLCTLLLSTTLFAREIDEKQRVLGIGVSVGFLGTTSQNIYFPINLTRSIRVEPEFGFATFDTKSNEQGFLRAGIGFLFIQPYKQFNTYFGTRFGMYRIEHQNYSFYENSSEKYEQIDGYISAVIGAEYFLAENFSIGGEIQLEYIKLDIDNERDIDFSTIQTKNQIFIRWYF